MTIGDISPILILREVTKCQRSAIFTESQLYDLSCGSVDNFDIHHVLGINIGGTNYDPKFIEEINQVFLSKREMKGLSHNTNEPAIFKKKLEHFLEMKEEQGQLKKTFENLFAGHLVLIPKALHEKLEKQLIHPSIVEASEARNKQILLPYTTRVFISPLSKEYNAMAKDGVTQFPPSTAPQKISSHHSPISDPEHIDEGNVRK